MTLRGLVLSEAPLGAVPQARHFPRRNRIVSGLSLGVLVIEAALQSGSLITARQAADQGRDVFAVPGSPLDPRCRGSNRLIRDGAQLVEEAADVLSQLRPTPPLPRAPRAVVAAPSLAAPRAPRKPTAKSSPAKRNQADLPLEGAAQASVKTYDRSPEPVETKGDSLSERILACLGRSATPVDELIRECHVSPALVTAALLDLELSGRVERLQGNFVALI
jgi:DNA processing protein